MPFTEKQKLEVKRKAAFRCCRCSEIGVEVHHIVPQSEDGPDDVDNAAPLCPTCHVHFGGNPDKRKEITQMRDWWYEVVEEKYKSEGDKYQALNDLLLDLQRAIETQSSNLNDLKAKVESELESIKTESRVAEQAASTLKSVVTEHITATRLADRVHANFKCRKCGTTIGLLIGSNKCPECGEPF